MENPLPDGRRPLTLHRTAPMPPDHLNEVGVLTRREIEARVILPLLEAFAGAFGEARVLEIARDVIVALAREQGTAMARDLGSCSLGTFAGALDAWKKGDAYEMRVLEQSDDCFAFDITRCRYAEMYRRLGVPELGSLLSCGRDGALIEGFNPDVTLTRTQTIMDGATHCDFRFARRDPSNPEQRG
jgi:hypothetical protein